MSKPYILLGAIALALSACNNASEDAASPRGAAPSTAPEVPAAPPQPVEDIASFKDSLEKAMADIPPDLREKFQAAFSCEIELNKTRPVPREMNAETIRDLTAQLKAGTSPSC